MIPVATIARMQTGDQGTIGIVSGPGVGALSLELPWRNNQSNISCIPAGEYLCKWSYSNHFARDLYHVQDVPGRFGVLIHPGNLAGDKSLGWKTHSEGCILLGYKYGSLAIKPGVNQQAVLLSQPAVTAFHKAMAQRDFLLRIVEV